jgi:hypothetical protein
MRLRVAVMQIAGSRRSQAVCDAFMKGIRGHGDSPFRMEESAYATPAWDAAVFYGLRGNLPRVLREFPEAGKKAVYIDLGYWGRVLPRRFNGYHKVSINDRHPTAYFRKHRHPNDRILKLGIRPLPWKKGGRKILVLGMGDKAAGVEGFQVEQWERETIAELAKHTDRPIVYRPKPSWSGAKRIEGAEYSSPETSLEEAFRDCHAVVTHHSNAAVDALVYGLPAFCEQGVAAPLSLQDLSRIESPLYPADREEWISDISYCQWTLDEIGLGLPWRHFKNEGLIP